MNETQKVQYLIVDTSAFIRNAPLQVKFFLYKSNVDKIYLFFLYVISSVSNIYCGLDYVSIGN